MVYHLSGRREISVDIVDLFLETLVQHLVGLVQYQHLDPAGPQGASADHVKHSSRSSRDDVLPIVQFPDVLPKVGPPNAGVTLHIHVVPKCQHHLKTVFVKSFPLDFKSNAKTTRPQLPGLTPSSKKQQK